MRTTFLLLLLLVASATEADAEKRERGVVRFALTGAIETLDPAKASSETARTCVSNIFDQLFEHAHHPRPYRLKPALAAAMPEISKDGLTQTLRLRKGVRYVDDPCFPEARGRTVRASDVVFCIQRLMDAHVKSPHTWILERKIKGLDRFALSSKKPAVNPTRSAYRTTEGYSAVKGLEVVDEHTLRVHLLQPTPALAWILASTCLSIYPPEAVLTYGDKMGRRAVGTGPYRVLLYGGTSSLTLRRNPRFREERSLPAEDGGPTHLLPRNDTVEVRAYKDQRSAWAAFLSDQVDCAEVARDAFTASVDPRTEKLLPHLAERGVRLHRDPRQEIYYDGFNFLDPVLGKPAGEKGLALRTAICLATDDRWAMTRLYTNHAERVYGPILPEMAGYKRGFTNPTMPAEGESRAEALEVAREVLVRGGITDPSKVPTLRMHISPDQTSRQVFAIFKRQVGELGLKVESVPTPWKELKALLKKGKTQMFTSAWLADYPDAQNFLQCFYSRNTPEPNYTRFADDEFDEAYEEALGTPSGEEREALMRELQDIVVKACLWRYRFRRIRWTATHKHLDGYRYNDVAPKHFKHCARTAKDKGKGSGTDQDRDK